MAKKCNANYDESGGDKPMRPIGHGGFANMPERPIMHDFGNTEDYRDGIVDGFTAGLSTFTKIKENQR